MCHFQNTGASKMPNMILRGHKECPKSEKVSQKVSHAVRFSRCNAMLCYHSQTLNSAFLNFVCHDDEDDEDEEDEEDEEDKEDEKDIKDEEVEEDVEHEEDEEDAESE